MATQGRPAAVPATMVPARASRAARSIGSRSTRAARKYRLSLSSGTRLANQRLSGQSRFPGVGALGNGPLTRSIIAGLAAYFPLLVGAMQEGRVGGTLHAGSWHDIGTPERLAALDQALGG